MSIEVHIRVRPNESDNVWSCADSVLFCSSRADKGASFQFNRVHSPSVSNDELFRCIEPLVRSAFDGHNVTLMAYGQTGSGKTYSMIGTPKNRGLVPLSAQILLALASKLEGTKIYASAAEIYNEALRDLLTTGDTKEVQLHDGPHNSVVYEHASTLLSCWSDYVVFSSRAESCRKYGVTDLNDHSSRSHTLMMFEIRRPDKSVSTLYLVDLAGSECAAKANTEGLQLREGGFINKSLLALGNVVEAIVDQRPYVPFRDSKLTRLLRPCLEGTGLTYVLCCVNPAQGNYDQTVNALRFAQRAMKIKTDPTETITFVPLLTYQFAKQIEEEARRFEDTHRVNFEQGVAEGYLFCRDWVAAKIGQVKEDALACAAQWDRTKLALVAHESLQYFRRMRELKRQAEERNTKLANATAAADEVAAKLRVTETELQDVKAERRKIEIAVAEARVAKQNAASDAEFRINELKSTLVTPFDVINDDDAACRQELQCDELDERKQIMVKFYKKFQDSDDAAVIDTVEAREAKKLWFAHEIDRNEKEIADLQEACAMLEEDDNVACTATITDPPPPAMSKSTMEDLHLETRLFVVETEERSLRETLNMPRKATKVSISQPLAVENDKQEGTLAVAPTIDRRRVARAKKPAAKRTASRTPVYVDHTAVSPAVDPPSPVIPSARRTNAELKEMLRKASLQCRAPTKGARSISTAAKTPIRSVSRIAATPERPATPGLPVKLSTPVQSTEKKKQIAAKKFRKTPAKALLALPAAPKATASRRGAKSTTVSSRAKASTAKVSKGKRGNDQAESTTGKRSRSLSPAEEEEETEEVVGIFARRRLEGAEPRIRVEVQPIVERQLFAYTAPPKKRRRKA